MAKKAEKILKASRAKTSIASQYFSYAGLLSLGTNPTTSVRYLRRSLELGTKNNLIIEALASALVRTGNFPEATKVYERLKETKPQNYFIGLANISLEQGLYAEAEAFLRQALLVPTISDQETRRFSSSLAGMLAIVGRSEEAKVLCHQLLGRAELLSANDLAEVYHTFGNIAREEQNNVKALSQFERAQQLVEKEGDLKLQAYIQLSIGQTHLALWNWAEASTALNKVDDIIARYPFIIRGLHRTAGEARLMSGDFEGAMGCYEKESILSETIGDKKARFQARLKIADISLVLHENEKSFAIATQLKAESVPGSKEELMSSLRLAYAYAYAGSGKEYDQEFAELKQEFARSELQLENEFGHYHLEMGVNFLWAGQIKIAVLMLETAIGNYELVPNVAPENLGSCYTYLGCCRRHLGDIAGAEENWATARDLFVNADDERFPQNLEGIRARAEELRNHRLPL